MLLITLLLGNMIINVLYFVISSVLLLRMHDAGASAISTTAFAIGSLLAMILAAEVAPKLVATQNAVRWATVVSGPLLLLHDIILPIRYVISMFFIQPMMRVVGPEQSSAPVQRNELADYMKRARANDDITVEEERVLSEIVDLHHLRARDIMIPRVRLLGFEDGEFDVDDVIERARSTQFRFLPVYGESMDQVLSILDVQRYLLATTDAERNEARRDPVFIPEQATLDHLLDLFRRTAVKAIVIVDEYGQTAGLVPFDNIIREIVGSADVEESADGSHQIQMTEVGRWLVAGDLPIHEFCEAFDVAIESPNVSTIAGYVTEYLEQQMMHGRSEFDLGKWRLSIADDDGRTPVTITVEAINS